LKWRIIANGSTDNREGIIKAVSRGGEVLVEGGSAIDAVEASISTMEDDPNFDAGTGCDINLFGLIMMDAGIMDGRQLRAGAIGAVRGIKNPILVARRLMDKTSNVLLVGEGAEEFAKTISRIDPKVKVGYDARTEDKIKKFKNEMRKILDEELAIDILSNPGGSSMTLFRLLEGDKRAELQKKLSSIRDSGTVSASALDKDGNYAAGASTGGWTFAFPGRIGDSPIIGCGSYADNRCGCSSTAGIRGEENMLLGGLTRRVCDRMENGKSAQLAVEEVTRYALDRIGLNLKRGSLIAIDKNGDFGFNYEQTAPALSIALMEEGKRLPKIPF